VPVEPVKPELAPTPASPEQSAMLSEILRTREAELASANRALAQQKEATKAVLLRSEIANAMAGHQFVSDAARRQVSSLIERELRVIEQDGALKAIGLDGSSASEYVASQLAKNEYAHTLRAVHNGGTGGAQGGHLQGPGTVPPAQIKRHWDGRPISQSTGLPMTMGEAALHASALLGQAQATTNVPAMMNMAVGVGGVRARAENHPAYRKA
jgi:hypothetical protein